jgi:DNA-binding LacI/PurR family transcriptional regulator
MPSARDLMDATPSLIKLLGKGRPTALIAFNDEFARDRYDWCKIAGIRIPRDLSIVSFDNMPANLYVSTVDFGFSRLGYQTAHIFIGDIPISDDRHGAIPGICTLVDRGSIGTPGDPTDLERILQSAR